MRIFKRIAAVACAAARRLAAVRWYYLFTRLLVFIPVIICFAISAAIEIIVFRSVLTVLGFEKVAVFLALSLEIFKLIIPLLLVRRTESGAALQNTVVIALRMVLFFISFSCTFIAISNNLVDTNADAITAQNAQIQASVEQDFKAEYEQRMDEVNRLADQKAQDKVAAYDIDNKKQQLTRLNEEYAKNHDWATYNLILEMNNSVTQAQNALNVDLNAIESERSQSLEELRGQYSGEQLALAVSAAQSSARNGDKYDRSQNTNITKMLYLIEKTIGLKPSYEMVIVIIAILICFASECIIWTGSMNLISQMEKRHMPKEENTFEQEVRRRIAEGETSSASLSVDASSLPSIILYNDRLMSRLTRLEKKRIGRVLNLMVQDSRNQYKEQMRKLKGPTFLERRREAARKRREKARERRRELAKLAHASRQRAQAKQEAQAK